MTYNGNDRPHIKLVDGIHPSELVFYMHQNKAVLEDFEKTYGNILTYRSIWTKATKIRRTLFDDILGKGCISKDQEDALKISVEQLIQIIFNNITMTSKVNDDLVRHLTSLIFWEQEFGYGYDSISYEDDLGIYVVNESDNTEILKKALSRYGNQILKYEFGLESEADPRVKEYVDKLQATYGNFKTFREKRKIHDFSVDLSLIGAGKNGKSSPSTKNKKK